MAVEPTPGVEAWSFGMFLCMREPGTSAVLQGVVAHETVGSGVEEVGIVVHEVTFSSGEAGTISTDEFPPAEAADVVAVDGYVLTIECVPSGPEEVAEVVVGLGLSGGDGGGWLGADVKYTVGDRDYVLEINNEMLICGEAAALYCDQPVSPSSE